MSLLQIQEAWRQERHKSARTRAAMLRLGHPKLVQPCILFLDETPPFVGVRVELGKGSCQTCNILLNVF